MPALARVQLQLGRGLFRHVLNPATYHACVIPVCLVRCQLCHGLKHARAEGHSVFRAVFNLQFQVVLNVSYAFLLTAILGGATSA
jgi:hypothetical protein